MCVWGMPDWQPCTMRFFCYQEQQGSSSLGFPDSLHQCLTEKLHSSQGCSGLWAPAGEQLLRFQWNPSLKELWESHIFSEESWAQKPLICCRLGQSHHNQPGLGRVQVRVGGKDPVLFGMLSTAFLFLEQIHSFWMGFTEQNASGWEPTKQVI